MVLTFKFIFKGFFVRQFYNIKMTLSIECSLRYWTSQWCSEDALGRAFLYEVLSNKLCTIYTFIPEPTRFFWFAMNMLTSHLGHTSTISTAMPQLHRKGKIFNIRPALMNHFYTRWDICFLIGCALAWQRTIKRYRVASACYVRRLIIYVINNQQCLKNRT